jgi:hypothetical protein
VVRVLGYRSRSPGSIPGTTTKKVAGLEWSPLSLVSTTEELLKRKSSGSCLENLKYGRRGSVTLTTRHPLSAKSWQSLRRQAAVAGSIQFARGLRPWSLVFLVFSITKSGIWKYNVIQKSTIWNTDVLYLEENVTAVPVTLSKMGKISQTSATQSE